MSKKVVEIVQDGSYRAAQPAQVQLVEGNTIEFQNGEPGGTQLVLTIETRSILLPTPESNVVHIASGASFSFEVKALATASYCCQMVAEGTEPRPIVCTSSSESTVLNILSSDERSLADHTGRGL